MKPEVQHIAITTADGSLAIMQFVTKARGFERQATDEAIAAEIAKAGIAAMSWRQMGVDDVIAYRAGNATAKGALVDDGKSITVDPVRKAALDAARAAVRDPLAEFDALKAALVAKSIVTDADVTAEIAAV